MASIPTHVTLKRVTKAVAAHVNSEHHIIQKEDSTMVTPIHIHNLPFFVDHFDGVSWADGWGVLLRLLRYQARQSNTVNVLRIAVALKHVYYSFIVAPVDLLYFLLSLAYFRTFVMFNSTFITVTVII